MVIAWLKKLTRSTETNRSESYGQAVTATRFSPETTIPQELIARRAYEKWVARGQPAGTSTQDWLEAEAELRAERRPNECR